MPSFTSNSDPRTGIPRIGVPWAFLGALLVVGLVELAVRSTEPRALLPYDLGENEYYAAAGHVEAYGPAKICVVGSSRAKEAVVVPDLKAAMGAEVRNYSCAGARADEIRALVDDLLRAGPPKLVLCGVSPRVFLDDDPRWSRSAIFWNVDDWRRAESENSRRALTVLPIVARNEIGRYWQTLRYRFKPAVLTDDIWVYYEASRDYGLRLTLAEFLAGETRPSPLNGELTERQRDLASRSLLTNPVSEARVHEYVERLLTGGEYVMGDTRQQELVAMAVACRERDVPLVFFEVPVSEILHAHLPPDVYPRFFDRMSAVARIAEVEFLPADSLDVSFADADFMEQSHLNRAGAEKLTAALARALQQRHLP